MLIERNVSPYVVRDSDSIQDVATHIATTKGRIAFVVDNNGVLLGTVSNGDLIRWIAAGCVGGDSSTVLTLANRQFKSASAERVGVEIADLLQTVLFVPLVDSRGRLISVARRREAMEGIQIEGRKIGENNPVYIIAEIGNNHNGSLAEAIRLIDAAAEAGADCAKFQMRDMATLYGGAIDGSSAGENLGTQYVLDLLARYQLSNDDLFRCFDHCRKRGMSPLCTPWDEASLIRLEHYGMPGYKVASADLTNHPLLSVMAATGKPLICSTGMATEAEIEQSTRYLQERGASYLLLHCNSTYPAPFRDVHLNYLKRLSRLGDCTVGYSGHERDYFVAVAAVAMGARVIEKHFTFDRGLEGNDHKVSLLPNEFKRMVEGIRQVEDSMGVDAPRRISQGELMNRVTLAKSVFAKVDIPAGVVVEEEMLEVRSPGRGLQPNRRLELIGRRVGRAVTAGQPFFPSDLDEVGTATAIAIEGKRTYNFGRPWGIPVRHHDYRRMLELSSPDFLEFHLSYRDLELVDEEFFDDIQPMDLVVHAPELFENDHVMDLCSPDEAYRSQSVAKMKRVIDKSMSLRRFFKVTGKTGIVTNVGGFSQDRALTAVERQVRKLKLKQSLSELNFQDCEMWPQTMPPFPWHFGGQRFHNLFVEADEIVSICADLNLNICLDISHSKLACNNLHHSFDDFIRRVAHLTKHIHLADAAGLDGEGLQIGDGEVDFITLFKILNEDSKNAIFLPEIWQGHENEGEGFWSALDRLSVKLKTG
jgi:sialic acid synthase SpsE/sugar phosphate isomerase/epimerase